MDKMKSPDQMPPKEGIIDRLRSAMNNLFSAREAKAGAKKSLGPLLEVGLVEAALELIDRYGFKVEQSELVQSGLVCRINFIAAFGNANGDTEKMKESMVWLVRALMAFKKANSPEEVLILSRDFIKMRSLLRGGKALRIADEMLHMIDFGHLDY